jgi:hypothetical protein
MADEESDDEGSIFKVDTIPPPAGDGDAYNAPTKVGPVSAEAWVELIKQADAEGKKAAEAETRRGDSGPLSKPPVSRPQPASNPKPPASGNARGASASAAASSATNDAAPASKPSGEAPPAAVPRLYENDDADDSHAATMLSPNAKGSVVDAGARADASVFGPAAAMIASATPAEEPVPQNILGPSPRQTAILPALMAACVVIFAACLVYYLFAG